MSIAYIATVNDSNVPHAAARELVWEDGALLLLEELEGSRTNSDLVHSLWFGRTVSIFTDGKSVTASPRVCHIAGPVFERFYRREKPIAAVWELTPVCEYTESREKQLAERPLLRHLDQIAKEELS